MTLKHEPGKAASDAPRNGRGRVLRSSTARGLVAAAVFVAVGIGLAFPTGTGTLSSLGWNAVAAICPLGALESLLGTGVPVVRALVALVAVILIVVVVGKAFCSWVCPVPHIQDLFKSKKRRRREAEERQEAADRAWSRWKDDVPVSHPTVPLDSRHAILGGALLSTAIFGFPVFCLVCPIGLTFATFVLLWRLIQFNEPTVGLLVFPAIVVVEVVVLRKWCGKLCPMGALLSLVSTLNRRFRPTVNTDVCLRDTGQAGCRACAAACPEHIDPYADRGDRPMTECVKCRRCADSCPVHALALPLKSQKPDPANRTDDGGGGESCKGEMQA